jgi:hypothetical protein
MMVTTAARISIVRMMSSTMMASLVEEIVEWTAAKELSKHFLGISEHEGKAGTKNEVVRIERIATSSTMMSSHVLIVIYQALLSILIINSSLFF